MKKNQIQEAELFFVSGQLFEAEILYRKIIKTKSVSEEQKARIYCNLGIIYSIQGELKKAEAEYLNSLEINKKLNRPEGLSNIYCNLGVLYSNWGDMAEAEKMYRNVLDDPKATTEEKTRGGGANDRGGRSKTGSASHVKLMPTVKAP